MRHVFGLVSGFANLPPTSLAPVFPFPVVLSFCVPTVLSYRSTGISTCCPSTTPLGLALGPDLPRADQLYSGNLGYSAGRILTFLLSSIQSTAPSGTASSRMQCSSTNVKTFLSFGDVFQPRTFSAQDLSTSELLRTLLMCGCF